MYINIILLYCKANILLIQTMLQIIILLRSQNVNHFLLPTQWFSVVTIGGITASVGIVPQLTAAVITIYERIQKTHIDNIGRSQFIFIEEDSFVRFCFGYSRYVHYLHRLYLPHSRQQLLFCVVFVFIFNTCSRFYIQIIILNTVQKSARLFGAVDMGQDSPRNDNSCS